MKSSNSIKTKVERDQEISNVSEFPYLELRVYLMFTAMTGMLVLVALPLFDYLEVYGEEQEQEQPTISVCKEGINETKCNQIEPVCPETFPGCVGNSSSSNNSSKP